MTSFDNLSLKWPARWPCIESARHESKLRREELQQLIKNDGGLLRPDTNFVVFGSIARSEWTQKSDIDWSLLVDGQTDPEDMGTAKRVESLLIENKWTKPGPSGIFGSLAFSHSLVHEIGGGTDSYINTTRRILLLLESVAIGDEIVRARVIRSVLARYLEEDTHFHPTKGSRSFVPRFLLNDIVRYWRTIAVDYANKTREANKAKWALRNIKLRMSRKLIYVAGLLMCFLCHLKSGAIQSEDSLGDPEVSSLSFVNYLAERIDETPIDLLARAVRELKISDKTIQLLFDSYNRFLETLNDPSSRAHLENLNYQSSKEDRLFQELRDVGWEFQEGLRALFFDENQQLSRLAQVYAMF